MDIRKFFTGTKASKRLHSPSDSSDKSDDNDESPERALSNENNNGQGEDCHPEDIGKWINMPSAIPTEKKRELLKNVWVPPRDYDFAADATHLKRKFNHQWLDLYKPWLVYSRRLKGAFCLHCVLFKPIKMRGNFNSFIIRPFKKFKNVHEYCKAHAASTVHKQTTESAQLFLNQTPVDVVMQRGHENIVEENRKLLKSIIGTIIFCGTHDLPLRGKQNDEGILRGLILLKISAGDEALKKNMEDGKKNANYMSPRIQNEILEISAKILREHICKDIRKASAYSILADETADMSGKEQLSIGIRFFDQKDLMIREEFVGFVELMAMDADTIAENIKNFVMKINLDPDKCVGLGFDGCATMAGKTGGVQKILKGTFKKSFYVHCASHRLNLVVNDLNAVPEIRNSTSTIKDVINFFKESVTRRKYAPNVHSFSETRWSEKYQSISDFKKNYCEIVEGLENLCREGNAGTRKLAFQLHSAASKSIFLVSMCTIAKYYALLQPVVNIMQSKNIDIIKCREHIQQILGIIELHRSTPDIVFNEIFRECLELAEKVSIDIAIPRIVEKQKNRSNPPFTTATEYFQRSIFVPYIDSLISSIKQRFSEDNSAPFNLTALHPNHIKNSTYSDIKDKLNDASIFYNLKDIEHELELWFQNWKSKKEEVDLIMAYEQTSFFPKIRQALEIVLAMPCTTATVERSFSTLRRVKTWLRTTMSENRLNGERF